MQSCDFYTMAQIHREQGAHYATVEQTLYATLTQRREASIAFSKPVLPTLRQHGVGIEGVRQRRWKWAWPMQMRHDPMQMMVRAPDRYVSQTAHAP